MRPAIFELRWDDQVLEKLWKKHRVQSWEVEDVVLDDAEADFRWREDRRHGGRLLVRGRTRGGRRLLVMLDPIDPNEGIWRCRLGGTMRDISREEAERMWEEATPVEVDRRPRAMTTVLSIRMPRELLRELEIAARSRGKGPTTLARELIEQGLALGPSASVPLLAKVASRLAEETAGMARGRRSAGRGAKKPTTTARRRAG